MKQVEKHCTRFFVLFDTYPCMTHDYSFITTLSLSHAHMNALPNNSTSGPSLPLYHHGAGHQFSSPYESSK